MKKLNAILLAGAAVFAMNGCTGGTTSSTSGGTTTTTTGNYISIYSLDGYALIDYSGSRIDFCDGIAYVYDNYNGTHYGDYGISGESINFYDNDGGSYRIDSDGGYIYEGYSYSVVGVETITVDAIGYANCY